MSSGNNISYSITPWILYINLNILYYMSKVIQLMLAYSQGSQLDRIEIIPIFQIYNACISTSLLLSTEPNTLRNSKHIENKMFTTNYCIDKKNDC